MVALAQEPVAERREFPISVLHHPRERIGIAAPPAANQIVPTEIGPAEIDEVNQEQRFAFAFGKVNKRRHVFLDRFQAFDRFVRRRRFILEIALYAEIEILFRRRLEHRRDQPRTIRIEFLFRHTAEREVTLQISVGSRIDVVLQAIAFSVLAGLAKTFGGGFHRFRFRFEDATKNRTPVDTAPAADNRCSAGRGPSRREIPCRHWVTLLSRRTTLPRRPGRRIRRRLRIRKEGTTRVW